MTPRMLLKAQAQETAYQYGLEENKTKIDYSLALPQTGLLSPFARGAKMTIWAMPLARLSARLETKWCIRVKCALLPSGHTRKPCHSIAGKAVCGGVA